MATITNNSQRSKIARIQIVRSWMKDYGTNDIIKQENMNLKIQEIMGTSYKTAKEYLIIILKEEYI